jgi:predicted lactoylglutathione lyase
MDKRLSIVTLGVGDLARSTAFYEALGWKKSSASQETISFFQLKGVVLGLFSRASLAHDAGIEDTGKGFSGITLAHTVSSEAEVDAAFQHALTCGASAIKTPQNVFWGGYSSYFADPDGHLWEVAFNPFVPMDDQGHLVLPD